MPDLEKLRSEFAQQLRAEAHLHSASLVAALARVPRERFVGPGPWQIIDLESGSIAYQQTPDDDPTHLYRNVLVALDASRSLNNGHPGSLAGWLDALDLQPGERVVHLGCGTGYYTAIMAEMVGPDGGVLAVEIDAAIAERARRNLRPWSQVEVVAADGSQLEVAEHDAIFVNAGVTHPAAAWTRSVRRPGGRIILPLTYETSPGMGAGAMLLLTARTDRELSVRMLSPVMVFSCAGSRDASLDPALRAAFEGGGADELQTLTLSPTHAADGQCWFHCAQYCLAPRRTQIQDDHRRN
jgi:protein-L-isoaspartate(D-aspartate) O-methyltransferase